MGLMNRAGGESFLAGHGSGFPQQDVVVVHLAGEPGETRQTVRSHVQASKAFFDVDAPVFEGDEIELSDPR